MYNLIKSIDPYHVSSFRHRPSDRQVGLALNYSNLALILSQAITGAAQCANSWMWNDVPSAQAPEPAGGTKKAVIPFSAQPQLQLGQDFFCQENYKQQLWYARRTSKTVD